MRLTKAASKEAQGSSTQQYNQAQEAHLICHVHTKGRAERGCSPPALTDMDIPQQEPAAEKRDRSQLSWCSPLQPRSPGTFVTCQTHQLLPTRWEVSSRQPACPGPMATRTRSPHRPLKGACPPGWRQRSQAPVTSSASCHPATADNGRCWGGGEATCLKSRDVFTQII